MLSERGLSTSSVVTGFVSDDEKWDYLVHAQAVLYPSSYEGFGLVATEAFAAGVPLVSGTGGALGEVGGKGAIFVDPTSVDSIVQGLRSACDPACAARGWWRPALTSSELLRRRSGGYAPLLGPSAPLPAHPEHPAFPVTVADHVPVSGQGHPGHGGPVS